MQVYVNNTIQDWSRPGLITTSDVDKQGAGGNWVTVIWRPRERKHARKLREKSKVKNVGQRGSPLSLKTMTGKGTELADMMQRTKVGVLCVQDTKRKGSMACSFGSGFNMSRIAKHSTEWWQRCSVGRQNNKKWDQLEKVSGWFVTKG